MPHKKSQRLMRSVFAILVIAIAFGVSPLLAQSVSFQTEPVKWSGKGLKVELQAMPLDLVRAFFLGRGFDSDNADHIARTGCIFRSAMGHASSKPDAPPITVELAKWRVITQSGEQAPKTRQNWEKTWKTRTVSEAAKAAFYWAFFPTRQTYQAADYNWGMISFALPPGTKFDLEIRWLKGDAEQSVKLTELECGK